MGASPLSKCGFFLSILSVCAILVGNVAQGFTVYMQDLGSDFVPMAGNELGHLVGYRLSTNRAAWRLPDGEIVNLGTLGGPQSRALGISDDGSSVVGWAHNEFGTPNAFRYENGAIDSIMDVSLATSQAFGIDANNNIYLNLQSTSNSVRRWNRVGGTVSVLINNAQATGVNSAGHLVGKNTSGTTFRFAGFQTPILPSTFNPVAGINDSDLTAGSLGGLAAYHQATDAMAQTIPGIAALGSSSTATGVNDDGIVVGSTAATVFHYSVTSNVLTDLNTGSLEGADALYLLELYGVTDNNIFFGKYITTLGLERYFRGSLSPLVSEGIPGDFDHDGDVDGRDFLVWQRNPNVGTLSQWHENYGAEMLTTDLTTTGAGSAIPEPGASLWIICTLYILHRQRIGRLTPWNQN